MAKDYATGGIIPKGIPIHADRDCSLAVPRYRSLEAKVICAAFGIPATSLFPHSLTPSEWSKIREELFTTHLMKHLGTFKQEGT